jgi:hypothetical protein
LIGCLRRTPDTYHLAGIKRGTATSNFHAQRDNLGEADMRILVATASLVPELGYAIPQGQWAIDLDLEVAGKGRFRTPPLPITVIA